MSYREDVLERTRQRAMLRMWRAVGGLLSVFIFLDEIIRSHPLILSHWSFFVKFVLSSHKRFLSFLIT